MSNPNIILDIPNFPTHLKHDILNGKTIIFVGSGFSRLAGMPSWKELAKRRLEEVRKRELISYETYHHLLNEKPLKILSICENFLDREKWHDCLCAGRDREREKQIAALLAPFDSGFITTNYDDLLELVPIENPSNAVTKFHKPHTGTKNYHVKEETTFDSFLIQPKHKVYYLHGKDLSDTNPPICTLQDYFKHYRREGKGRQILEELCAKKSILFIGVGLEEFEILEHIHMSRYENQHYALIPMFLYEEKILKQYRAYYGILNIDILPYNISKNGYEQLENVLKEWGQILLHEKDSFDDVSKHLQNNVLIDGVAHGLD